MNEREKTIRFYPYSVVSEHLRSKPGQEQETFYNTIRGELVDIHDNPVPIIELTPEQLADQLTPEQLAELIAAQKKD